MRSLLRYWRFCLSRDIFFSNEFTLFLPRFISSSLYLFFPFFDPCSGNTPDTQGRGFVVYEDIFDAQEAQKHMHGFSIDGRYLAVQFYKPPKRKVTAQESRLQTEKSKTELEELRARYGVGN